MDEPAVTIKVRENGPYLVKGPVTIVDHQDIPFEMESDTVALCRCGHSARKPFCDATHKTVGFDGSCPRAAAVD